jgi:hypothetical protein
MKVRSHYRVPDGGADRSTERRWDILRFLHFMAVRPPGIMNFGMQGTGRALYA